MRQVIDPQLQFGEQDISAIELDFKSRDDIPRILRGLEAGRGNLHFLRPAFRFPEQGDSGLGVSA